MKKSLLICGLVILKLANAAQGNQIYSADWTLNTAIPDGNPVGITSSETFPSVIGKVLGVSVDLDITGGYNGDLIGYLDYTAPNGHTATETLLNRVGASSSNPFGSAGSGFNVVLSDSGTVNGSIHNAAGNPTGTWLPDSTATLDATFGGLQSGGTWTLFVADMSVGGGTEVLDNWGLTVTVPDQAPAGWLLGIGGLLLAAAEASLRLGRQKLHF